MNFAAAADYAGRHGLEAMLVRRAGETLFERYAPGFDATTPHALYSGTKSFWGVAAVAASEDGLLRLDEAVGDTFAPWRVGTRSFVTLRMLLALTSGIGFGGLGSAVPSYEKALAVELKNEPGETFTYGGIPLQVFGAVFAAKLAPRNVTPHAYLRERILDPIGCSVASWRTLKDGTNPLPTGAFLDAENWSTYGAFVASGGAGPNGRIVSEAGLASCFVGSAPNPRYGLGWWRSPLPDAFPDLVYASGSGGQALYVIPSADLTIVKFSKSGSYAHETFLRRLRGRDRDETTT